MTPDPSPPVLDSFFLTPTHTHTHSLSLPSSRTLDGRLPNSSSSNDTLGTSTKKPHHPPPHFHEQNRLKRQSDAKPNSRCRTQKTPPLARPHTHTLVEPNPSSIRPSNQGRPLPRSFAIFPFARKAPCVPVTHLL
ncbi:hypothetical protein LX36DRAFT_315262 [Colletotrichum falcatum]|nr:hypothetical protein LX36DRAFT_315262 [Colletotrichum falcatum]